MSLPCCSISSTSLMRYQANWKSCGIAPGRIPSQCAAVQWSTAAFGNSTQNSSCMCEKSLKTIQVSGPGIVSPTGSHPKRGKPSLRHLSGKPHIYAGKSTGGSFKLSSIPLLEFPLDITVNFFSEPEDCQDVP